MCKFLLLILLSSCGQSISGDTIKADTTSKTKANTQNVNSIHIDTFIIQGVRFKIISNKDTSSDLEVDVLKNGRWTANLKMPQSTNGYSINEDVNQDGYNDFQNSLLRGNEVYLFDPIKMQFSKDPIFLAFDWSLIDKKQKLYSNNYESHDYYETDLFELKGLRQIFYYTAPINYKIEENKETAILRLYKISNNDLSDTTFIAQKEFDLLKSDFDYKKFWKDFINKNGYR